MVIRCGYPERKREDWKNQNGRGNYFRARGKRQTLMAWHWDFIFHLVSRIHSSLARMKMLLSNEVRPDIRAIMPTLERRSLHSRRHRRPATLIYRHLLMSRITQVASEFSTLSLIRPKALTVRSVHSSNSQTSLRVSGRRSSLRETDPFEYVDIEASILFLSEATKINFIPKS